jgi:ABC-type thiamin/hydroxymethylpyrimidine transport system permease subunit
MSLNKNLGLLLLGVWLIVSALLSLLNVGFPGSGLILAVLAVAAGVLILLKR